MQWGMKRFKFNWLSGTEQSYQSLAPDVDDKSPGGDNLDTREPNPEHVRWRPRANTNVLLLLATTVILTAALCCLTVLHLRLIAATSPPARESCGDSVEEARARGCVFDELITSWMPASCSRAGTDGFAETGRQWDNGSWRYYLDHDRTQEITYDELSSMAR
jgi:hypothetical protein